jgi:hypothetical protein
MPMARYTRSERFDDARHDGQTFLICATVMVMIDSIVSCFAAQCTQQENIRAGDGLS